MERTIDINEESIISLCPLKPSHTDFLLQLFKECRPDLALIGNLNEKQKDDFILQQFTIEEDQLSKMYPDAEFNIVMLNEKPIGRFYVYHSKLSDHIVEIGLLESYRGLGIGKKIMITAIENALRKGNELSLQVAWFNQRAYSFYERLGFRVIEDNLVLKKMQYMPHSI